jgi:hypothetical protein
MQLTIFFQNVKNLKMIKMKKTAFNVLSITLFVFSLTFAFSSTFARAQPPTPQQLFNGHSFNENHWDINVFNNSYWDHEDINPMVSWLNNTWNIKWMKEDNFEMGMLAFINKTMWDGGREVTYTTPAQLWWQHAYLHGSEIVIASMHSAWFAFHDDNSNGFLDIGEEASPFFFMGATTDQVRDTGIISNPKTIALPLERSVSGSKINYKWGYNYTDIIFFVPEVYHGLAAPTFPWGFNYSQVDTYVDGSHNIGNVTYFYYEYNLEIDTSIGEATLNQSYELGEIGAMAYRDNYVDPWTLADYGNHWLESDIAICLGTYSFIWAGQDWAITTPLGNITRQTHLTGLSEVITTLGGEHAFDFKFNQKPEYTIFNATETVPHTHDVSYQTWNVSDHEFINVVSGMIQLVGDFGKLVVGYVINQTNHFTYGIPMEEAMNATDPENMAAFFITCYPEYGSYRGGRLIHDPVFVAYFTPTVNPQIHGFPLEFIMTTLSIGIAIVLIQRVRKKNF